MTRKEFITTLIEKKLKPLLFLIVIAYLIVYLFHEHNDDTNNNVDSIFNLVFSIFNIIYNSRNYKIRY